MKREALFLNSESARQLPEIQEARGALFLKIKKRATRSGNSGSLRHARLPDGPSWSIPDDFLENQEARRAFPDFQ